MDHVLSLISLTVRELKLFGKYFVIISSDSTWKTIARIIQKQKSIDDVKNTNGEGSKFEGRNRPCTCDTHLKPHHLCSCPAYFLSDKAKRTLKLTQTAMILQMIL